GAAVSYLARGAGSVTLILLTLYPPSRKILPARLSDPQPHNLEGASPATTRSFCAVASSARTSATIVLSEKPCVRMTASVQPSGEESSRASARWLWEGRVRDTPAR